MCRSLEWWLYVVADGDSHLDDPGLEDLCGDGVAPGGGPGGPVDPLGQGGLIRGYRARAGWSLLP